MKVFLTGACASVVLLWAAPAVAHVTVQPSEAPIGSFHAFVVRVPNEKDDARTTRVEVKLPPLAFVAFEKVTGWDRRVKMTKLDEPLVVFGNEITEVPGTVVWTGGEVEPGEFQDFGFSARMPDEATTLTFEAIQTYDNGDVVNWTGPPDADEPAARVSAIDIGAGEDQGELGVIADLQGRVGDLQQQLEERPRSSATPATLLGGAGVAVGLVALAVAFRRTS
ncbi:MAG TPA: YcnI family protein [Actinomycetota bacterium]|nr:YcnI family protein [Actinomycetota bacterium]